MCGRFYIPPEDDDSGFLAILEQVRKNCKDSPYLNALRLGEVFPADVVPILTCRAAVLMKWGFSRPDGKGAVINARLETAEELPMFRRSYDTRRCLIPAGHYFEWRKDAMTNAKAKHKYAIGTGAPITMAGLYRFEPESPLPLFVILTRPAAPGIAFIHDRMPVIVPEHAREKWLSSPVAARELLEVSEEKLTYEDAV
jgi:putative SOS response-associated peptidase YedK